MTRDELIQQGLSEETADRVMQLQTENQQMSGKLDSLESSVSELRTSVQNLVTAGEQKDQKIESLETSVSQHATALETSEAAREALETKTAHEDAEKEAKSYAPLNVSTEACLAIAKLGDEDAAAIRETLTDAKTEVQNLHGIVGTPAGESPASRAGSTSPLSQFINEKMAEGMTRVEALAQPEAQRLAKQERLERARSQTSPTEG